MKKTKRKFLNKAIDMVDKELYNRGIGQRVTVDSNGFGIRLCDDIYGVLVKKERLSSLYKAWKNCNTMSMKDTLYCFSTSLAQRADSMISERDDDAGLLDEEEYDEYEDYEDELEEDGDFEENDFEDEEGDTEQDDDSEYDECRSCGLCGQTKTSDTEDTGADGAASVLPYPFYPFEHLDEATTEVQTMTTEGDTNGEPDGKASTSGTQTDAPKMTDKNDRKACPHCDSLELTKEGKDRTGVQRYRCKVCGKWFTEKTVKIV